MTKKPVAPEKKRNMWRGHKILFPVAATTLAACGVGFFAVYSCGFFINKPVTGATSYVFLFIFSLSFLIVYLPHYFISGKDKRGHWQCVSRAWVCAALLMVFVGAFDVYNTRCFVNTAPQIELEVWIGGILSLLGLIFLIHRTANQDEQLEIQTNKEIDDRFIAAVGLLGSRETSARTGAVYSLYELAIESDKYRKQIAQILCSHIRSKTREKEYKKDHESMPSNEIQTTIDLLFKNKGLYRQHFARNDSFPKASFSRAYLCGADFSEAECYGADFSHTDCQKASFLGSKCHRASFLNAQCQKADFRFAEIQGANFMSSWCQCVNFESARLHGAQFDMAQCQETNFFFSRCYGATFDHSQCQGADFQAAKCQGAYFNSTGLQGVNFKGVECQGAIFDDVAFQEAIFDDMTNFCGVFSCLTRSLEDRIGEQTQFGRIVFAGDFFPGSDGANAVENAKPYCSEGWYQKMQGIIKANQDKEEDNNVPEWFRQTGVLEDPKGVIRKIAAEIRKWRGDFLAPLSSKGDS